MEGSGQLQAPAALPPGKSPWYPLDRKLGGPQSRSGRGGEEKNSQPPPGIEPFNPDRPAHSLVAIPTELLQLWMKEKLNDFIIQADYFWRTSVSPKVSGLSQ
jgi:hypothetical protein